MNYSKDAQIDFTYKYYNNTIRKEVESHKALRKVAQVMNRYIDINSITQAQLTKGRNFEQAVNEMLK